jgi:hypothetical protein
MPRLNNYFGAGLRLCLGDWPEKTQTKQEEMNRFSAFHGKVSFGLVREKVTWKSLSA